MLMFPQLESGALLQVPFRRSETIRVPVNRLNDGSDVRGPEPFEFYAWDGALTGLTDSEAGRLQDLFDAVEGRTGTFLFLDPANNLLEWSEDFSRSSWQRGPVLSVATGIADPTGGTRAARVTNVGQGAQGLSQALIVPAAFTYCFSVYARAAAPTPFTLTVRCPESGGELRCAAGQQWQRFQLSAAPGRTAESVNFGLEMQAGITLELYGAQVDAQPGPSAYRKTLGCGGVHPRARFDQDRLEIKTNAPGSHETRVRIVSPAGA